MSKLITLFILSSLFTLNVSAQDQTILTALKSGHTTGYWRNYFMATTNEGSLQNWYALASGGLLKYESATFKNFKIGVGLYHTSNLYSNLDVKDALTGKISRYESGLFDANGLTNKEITVLGEAYLSYSNKAHQFKLGRFKLKTPLLNPEDGRMIPTLEQGLTYQYKPSKKFKLSTSLISHIFSRSTDGFYEVDKTIGNYPQGLTPDGTKSNYKGNLQSLGLAILTADYQTKNWGIKGVNYFVDNIYNTIFTQAYVIIHQSNVNHKISIQYINQTKINNGGNVDPSKTYITDKQSNIIGLQYKMLTKSSWQISANYNYVTNDGRFIFPRSWGRESLFVFQKRERLEGVSNAHAFMVDVKKSINLKKSGLFNLSLGYGQYLRPDAKDFKHNKYAMPANHQINFDLFYYANANKKGFGLEWLTSYKPTIGNTYNKPAFILNKVNMISHNLIVHYRF